MIALLLLLQSAPPAASAPERFSIITDACAAAQDRDSHDVVVCGRPDAIAPRIPLRDDRGVPNHGMPSNPDGTGIGALRGSRHDDECGAYGEHCPVGFGGSALPRLIGGAGDLARAVFARHPGKAGRVAIDLDTPPAPIPASAVRP